MSPVVARRALNQTSVGTSISENQGIIVTRSDPDSGVILWRPSWQVYSFILTVIAIDSYALFLATNYQNYVLGYTSAWKPTKKGSSKKSQATIST